MTGDKDSRLFDLPFDFFFFIVFVSTVHWKKGVIRN
jgi:hypothetical protein